MELQLVIISLRYGAVVAKNNYLLLILSYKYICTELPLMLIVVLALTEVPPAATSMVTSEQATAFEIAKLVSVVQNTPFWESALPVTMISNSQSAALPVVVHVATRLGSSSVS